MAIDLEKYRKPQSTAPVDLSKYRKAPVAPRYNVAPAPVDRQNKIAGYQADAATAAQEAKKANSFGGFMSNFGKALVSTVAPSEVGLGKSIASIFNPVNKGLQEAHQTGTGIQAETSKRIREKEARGEDTTRLKQSYNRLATQNEGDAKNIVTELPSTTKVAAQLGGTALDILSFGTYGKASGALAGMKTGAMAPSAKTLPSAIQGLRGVASKPAGIFTKKGAGRVLGGGALGYGYDVTQGLQGERGENREGIKAAIPGLGTALGVGIPAISGMSQTVKNVATPGGRTERTIEKRANVLARIEKDNGPVRRALESADAKRADVRRILAETDLLNGAVDSKGTISTKAALENFKEFIAPHEGKVRKALQDEGAFIPMKQLRKSLEQGLTDSKVQGGARVTLSNAIRDELKGLMMVADNNGNIPLTAVHDSKVFRMSNQNYMDPGANAVGKEVARVLKEIVEGNTRSIDVGTFNAELSKLYSVRDVLKALNGKKVEGGRLGRHFSSIVGAAAMSPLGPLGTIAGAEIGGAAKGLQMSRALGGKLLKPLTETKEMLGALQSINSGNRKITQTTTMMNTKTPPINAIPPTVLPTKKPSSGQGGQAFAGGAAGIEDTDGDGKPDNVDPMKAALGMAGFAAMAKRMHKDDQDMLYEFAFNEKPTAAQIKAAVNTMKHYGHKVPEKTKDFQEMLKDAAGSAFDKKMP